MATTVGTILVVVPGAVGDAVAAKLGDQGHFVTRAADAPQALAALRILKTDLVVLDRELPGRSELEGGLVADPRISSVRRLVIDADTPDSALDSAVAIELQIALRARPRS